MNSSIYFEKDVEREHVIAAAGQSSMRSRLLWTDGHSDIHDIDPTGEEITLVDEEGREHCFNISGQDAEGVVVWVEESREWERFHRNGRRALVCQHADVNPGRYSAGAPLRGSPTAFRINISSLDQAKRVADEATDCPQPCECPPWTE